MMLPQDPPGEPSDFQTAIGRLTLSDPIVTDSPTPSVEESIFTTLPNELIIHISSFLSKPAELLKLSSTCKSFYAILWSSESSGNNRIWYNFTDHTDHYRTALDKFRSWPHDDLNRFPQAVRDIRPDLDVRRHDPNDFWEIPERAPFVPQVDYRATCLNKLRRFQDVSYCHGCLLPDNQRCWVPELWIVPFSIGSFDEETEGYAYNRWAEFEENEERKAKGIRPYVAFCKACFPKKVTACLEHPFTALDLSSIKRLHWPEFMFTMRRDQDHYHNEPNFYRYRWQTWAGIFTWSINELFELKEFGGRNGSALYLIEEVNPIFREKFGIRWDEYPATKKDQYGLFRRVRHEVLKQYKKNLENYRFERTGILGVDALKTFLDDEWNSHHCFWGMLEGELCVNAIRNRLTRTRYKNDTMGKMETRKDHANSNMFDFLPGPPLNIKYPTSNELIPWVKSSAAIITEQFICDPILPLSPLNHNRNNFAQSAIWLASRHRFQKPMRTRAGHCYYCPPEDSTLYTPYTYAIHMYSAHNDEFHNPTSHWGWKRRRLTKGSRKIEFRRVLFESITTPKWRIDEYRNAIIAKATEMQYGPFMFWGPAWSSRSWKSCYLIRKREKSVIECKDWGISHIYE